MRTWAALVVSGFGQADGTADLLQASFIDLDVVAIEETSADSWRLFFPTTEARATAAAALLDEFPELTIAPIDVDDEDWAARSQASLRAVTVGDLVIAPPWDVPAGPGTGTRPTDTPAGPGTGTRPTDTRRPGSAPRTRQTIVILPSMGFGTGHHATTRLCLAALQQIDLAGFSVVDVGTGSGVLAIAASLLGAATVTGIDDDPDAIQAATDNLVLNPAARVRFEVVDLRAPTLEPTALEPTAFEPVDLVLANLTGGLLVSAVGQLQQLVRPGGRLVLSGLMAQEERDVLRAFSGARLEQRAQEDEWICVTLESPS